jgi:DNA-binding NtrC family response regulator
MSDAVACPVLVVHGTGPMRRILRLNLEMEQIPAVALTSLQECLDWLRDRPAAALVLDPCLLTSPGDQAAVLMAVRGQRIPVIVVGDGPEHRARARALDDAPYCSRPDRIEMIIAAVRRLISGEFVPAVV